LQVGGFCSGIVQQAVEDGNLNVATDSAIPVGNVIVADRRFADRAESGNSGSAEGVRGAAGILGGLGVQAERIGHRTVAKGLLE
jgi:hypothetical protein